MKKILYLTIATLFTLHYTTAFAQIDMFDIDELTQNIEDKENATPSSQTPDAVSETPNITKNDYISEYFDDMEEAQKAQREAGVLLEQKPNIISLRDSQKRLIKEGEEKRKELINNLTKIKEIEQIEQLQEDNPEQKIEIITQQINKKYEAAPFGLFWGISKEQTEQLGFILQPAERENYQNVNLVTNPKQKMQTFDIVTAIFGVQDKLWCIFAQSIPQSDTPQASNAIKLYQKYYQALEKKYGNAQQYFTPNTYTEDLIEGENGNKEPTEEEQKITTSANKNNQIGNDNFLKELQDGSATLYATFENEQLGVTLGVSVDENSKSYISIDYKNLQIMREEQKTKLENLISDI